MKIHRFIGDFDFKNRFLVISKKEFLNQIRNVLRLKKEELVILADGKLKEATAKIKNIKKESVELEILEIKENKNEPDIYGILYCSILKKQNFELVAQKATEVGVREIFPIISQRTIKTGISQPRLKKVIKEAAEQSERGVIPILNKTLNFSEALNKAKENSLNLLFDRKGISFGEFKIECIVGDKRIGIWIGSEGGWTEEELKMAQEQNFKIINLGKLNFRAETAAIIASYLLCQNIFK